MNTQYYANQNGQQQQPGQGYELLLESLYLIWLFSAGLRRRILNKAMWHQVATTAAVSVRPAVRRTGMQFSSLWLQMEWGKWFLPNKQDTFLLIILGSSNFKWAIPKTSKTLKIMGESRCIVCWWLCLPPNHMLVLSTFVAVVCLNYSNSMLNLQVVQWLQQFLR